jgi:hypothetical protein
MTPEQGSETRAHARTYLTEAGWARLDGEPPGGIAMRRLGEDATLSL